MGLFGRKREQQRQRESIRTDILDEFMQHYGYSGFYAGKGNLEAAYDELKEAQALAARSSSPEEGYSGYSCYWMAEFQWFELGNGTQGKELCRQGLKDPEGFRKLSKRLRDTPGRGILNDAYVDLILYEAMSAGSYSELHRLVRTGLEQVDSYDRYNGILKPLDEKASEYENKGIRFERYQFEMIPDQYKELARKNGKKDPSAALYDIMLDYADMAGYELTDDAYSEVFAAYLKSVLKLMKTDVIKDHPEASAWITEKPKLRLKESSARISSKYLDQIRTLEKGINCSL